MSATIHRGHLSAFLDRHIPHGGQQINRDLWNPLVGPLVRLQVHETPLHKPGVDEACLRCQFETEFGLERTKSPVEVK